MYDSDAATSNCRAHLLPPEGSRRAGCLRLTVPKSNNSADKANAVYLGACLLIYDCSESCVNKHKLSLQFSVLEEQW